MPQKRRPSALFSPQYRSDSATKSSLTCLNQVHHKYIHQIRGKNNSSYKNIHISVSKSLNSIYLFRNAVHSRSSILLIWELSWRCSLVTYLKRVNSHSYRFLIRGSCSVAKLHYWIKLEYWERGEGGGGWSCNKSDWSRQSSITFFLFPGTNKQLTSFTIVTPYKKRDWCHWRVARMHETFCTTSREAFFSGQIEKEREREKSIETNSSLSSRDRIKMVRKSTRDRGVEV